MYERHFNLRTRPFSMLPDPDYLFLGGRHALAMTLLEYGLSGPGLITVLTGEVGSGKTLLIRTLLTRMQPNYSVGILNNTIASPAPHGDASNASSAPELMRWVNMSFGLPYEHLSEAALYDTFTQHVVSTYASGKRSLLIIDEAQNLGTEALERLRLLTNLNVDQHDVLQLLVAGQPELRQLLERPNLRQFRQRVGVDYHLLPLDASETLAYIQHRVQVAGAPSELFDEAAMQRIHANSGGLPRAINLLCELALVYGFAADVAHVSEGIVNEVIRDRLRAGNACNSNVQPPANAADHALADGRAEHRAENTWRQ